jgi:hypothetical protein
MPGRRRGDAGKRQDPFAKEQSPTGAVQMHSARLRSLRHKSRRRPKFKRAAGASKTRGRVREVAGYYAAAD